MSLRAAFAACCVAVAACGPAEGPEDEAASQEATGEQPLSLSDPAYAGDFPDPFILRDGNEYHAFATNAGGANVNHLQSNDLAKWTRVADALPNLPGWAAPGFTWAPAAVKRGDGFVLYFTARHRASGRQCVGVATSPKAGGPYRPHGTVPLVCQLDMGGSIDASPFVDDDGRLFLVWKNDGNCCGLGVHLWSQQLTGDGLTLIGARARLLTHDRAWENPLIEAPAMVREGGRLFLFYSANWWESDRYATGYATCSGPLGPCTKQTTDGPWFHSIFALAGPGGAEFFRDTKGHLWMAYHAWQAGKVGYGVGGARKLWTTPVVIDGAGRPALAKRPEGRGVAMLPNGYGGVALNSWGEVRSFGFVEPARASAYWPNRDLARAIAVLPDGKGGYVLDGYGGIHPFAIGSAPMPPAARQVTGRWPGWDIARGFALLPDGSGGYVLDGWGGLHPFALGNHVAPRPARGAAYWKGWDIARGVVLTADGSGGYVLDGWGGLHAFAVGTAAMPRAVRENQYFKGTDLMRGVVLVPGGGGYVLDAWGSVWPFRTGPSVKPPPARGNPTWAWSDAARGISLRGDGKAGAVIDVTGAAAIFSF